MEEPSTSISPTVVDDSMLRTSTFILGDCAGDATSLRPSHSPLLIFQLHYVCMNDLASLTEGVQR